MATFLLDTSVIIDVLNGKRERDVLLTRLLNAGNLLACCPVNISEIYAGMRPKEQIATENFLESLDFYEITLRVAKLAGLLKRDYSKKGLTLSLPDTTIAAVAIEYDLTLITDNIKDFPMPEVRLYQRDR